MIKTLVLLTAFNFNFQTDTIPLINSNLILEQIKDLHEDENYTESITLLEQVSPYDSNYIQVQTALISAYGKNDQFDKAKELGQGLIESRSDLSSGFYITLGNTYLNEGLVEEAIGIYNEGLEIFPYNHSLKYNIGYVAYSEGNYETALSYLFEVLKINPFFSHAHQLLGNIMSKTEQRTKAVMSYLTYLAIDADENWALVRLNDLLSDGYRPEGSVELGIDNAPFEYYDNLLRSKAALDDRFKSNIDFEAPVAQQTELLINKIKHVSGTDDFWMDFYVPFLERIDEEGLTDAFVYFILYSSKNDDVNRWLEKNTKEKEKWIELVQSHLRKYKLEHERTILDSTGIYTHWYYNSGGIQAIGKEVGNSNVGPYEFYHPNGRLLATGRYNNDGKKTGIWKYFHDNGQVRSIEEHDLEGKLKGVIDIYHPDGKLKNSGDYKDGQLDGYWRWYYPCGNVSEEYPYVSGEGRGTGKVYFKTGEVKVLYHVDNDEYNGEYTTYFKSGQVSTQYEYVKGKKEGPYKSYFANGSKYETGAYENDQQTGIWETYHFNGNLATKGLFVKGNKEGQWEYYYSNGNKMRVENYVDEGNKQGLTIWYDEDGKMHSERRFDAGKLIAYKFYSKNGDVIFEVSNQEGTMTFQRFYPTGELYAEGKLVDGLLSGPYKMYHPNGNVFRVGTMKEDKLEGPLLEYDASGYLQVSCNYENGELNNYYRSFYENGQIKQEGWLKNGSIQQRWVEYFMNGTVKSEYYYRDGLPHGPANYFDLQGRLFSTEYYDEGVFLGLQEYDSLGNMYNKSTFSPKGGKLESKTRGGTTRMIKNLNCGEEIDEVVHYTSGRIVTRYTFSDSQISKYKTFNENGSLLAEGSYLDEERHGDWIYYYDNGEVEYKGTYFNGKREGKSEGFYENGILESECDRYQNERHGACKYYDPNGELQLIKFYRKDYGVYGYQYQLQNGNLSDTIKIDKVSTMTVESSFSNDKPSVIQEYEKGYYHGENFYYSIEGQALSKDQYVKGQLHGKHHEYYPDGTLRADVDYYFGVKHGKEKVYYKNGQLKEVVSWQYGDKNGWSRRYKEDGSLETEIFYRNDVEY